jgi:hypothetical protein
MITLSRDMSGKLREAGPRFQQVIYEISESIRERDIGEITPSSHSQQLCRPTGSHLRVHAWTTGWG